MFIEIKKDVFINIDKVTDFRIYCEKTCFWRFYLGDNNYIDSKRFESKEEAYSWLYKHLENIQKGKETYKDV